MQKFGTRAIIVASLISPLGAAAQEIRVDGVEIVSQGVYATQNDRTKPFTRTDEDVSTPLAAYQHLRTTHVVPACKGTGFGQEVRVTGAPGGAKVPLRRVSIPPRPLLDPLAAKPRRRMEMVDTYAIGRVGIAFYDFDEDWELAPGTWRQQLWYGDRKLLDQTFEIVASNCNAVSLARPALIGSRTIDGSFLVQHERR